MRLILALLLLLQLDPILGAALCFEREQAASAECAMPDRAPAADRALVPAGADVHGGCTVAQLCAQPAPAVVHMDPVFQIVPAIDRTVLRLEPIPLPSGAPATLFHPPRV